MIEMRAVHASAGVGCAVVVQFFLIGFNCNDKVIKLVDDSSNSCVKAGRGQHLQDIMNGCSGQHIEVASREILMGVQDVDQVVWYAPPLCYRDLQVKQAIPWLLYTAFGWH